MFKAGINWLARSKIVQILTSLILKCPKTWYDISRIAETDELG